MIYDIGEILKDFIQAENLPYVEVLAGVVQEETATKLGKQKGSFIQKMFPVYCPVTEPCDPNNIRPLVPDRKLKSLFYFERNGAVLFRGRERGYNNFTADLFLTVWMNPKELGIDECTVSAKVIPEILRILDKGHFNDPNGIYSKMLIRPISIRTKEKVIFSKWRYSNKFYNLLEFPYDYFQLRFQIDFSLHDNCAEQLQVQSPVVC